MKHSSTHTVPTIALAVVAAFTYSLPASAGDTEGCPRGSTSTQDVEGGGFLTAAAHQASATKRFELMDTNRDGKVTSSEISASRGAESIAWASRLTSATEKLSQLDTNRDGALTVKEYADSSQKVFDRLDVDGDGVLSDAEMLMPGRGSGR
jgi:Ca2+-binding EF-hand superfamily protein